MIIALSTLSILNGIFSLIFVSISLTVGAFIASKYFKYKQRTFLFVGIAWMGLCEPWLGSGISFLLAITTGEGLSPEMYAIIGMSFVPWSMLAWLIAFTDLIIKKHQKLILISFAIFGIIFEICLFYFLSVDPDLIVILSDPVDAEYQTIIRIFLFIILITIFITGMIFARESLKSKNPEIRLKGKLLLAAFLLFTIGGIFDGLLPLNIYTLTFARILLISSAIFFYCGFLLPNWVKKIFLKQE